MAEINVKVNHRANTLEELDILVGEFLDGISVTEINDVTFNIFPNKDDSAEEYKRSLEHYLTLLKEGKLKHLPRLPGLDEALVNAHLDEINKLK